MVSDAIVEEQFDTRAYRDALGCFATGVALITVFDQDRRARGFTVNSFSSVSLEPPIVLWCIDERSERFDLFGLADRFCINILDNEDESVARTFAKNGEAALDESDYTTGPYEQPILTRSIASFECSNRWRQRAGDHVVVFGTVQSFRHQGGDGLGYFRGGFTSVGMGAR